MNNLRFKKGMTMVEMIIVIFIFGIISLATAQFQLDVFRLSGYADKSLNAVFNSRQILKIMVSELRSTTISENGSYPLQAVATSTLTFYSDVDGDGLVERVRYFLQGTDFKKGIVEPTGNPYVYTGTETTVTLVSGVRNTATSIFTYYDTDYTGTTLPLSNPSVSDIRLIKVTIEIDEDPNKPPAMLTSTTQVSLRNLKDNL
ncbi:MAG: hypothetical protein RJA61_72 [Candidatus Parcubacteria bacterium]|jgi:prepilin-type N-terminal cleavage/methylation domain-containing protein